MECFEHLILNPVFRNNEIIWNQIYLKGVGTSHIITCWVQIKIRSARDCTSVQFCHDTHCLQLCGRRLVCRYKRQGRGAEVLIEGAEYRIVQIERTEYGMYRCLPAAGCSNRNSPLSPMTKGSPLLPAKPQWKCCD